MNNVKFCGGAGRCPSEISKLAAGGKTLGNVIFA